MELTAPPTSAAILDDRRRIIRTIACLGRKVEKIVLADARHEGVERPGERSFACSSAMSLLPADGDRQAGSWRLTSTTCLARSSATPTSSWPQAPSTPS